MDDRARFQLGAGYPVITAVVASVPPGVRVCPRRERVVAESLMLAQDLAVLPPRIRGLDDRRSRERTNQVFAYTPGGGRPGLSRGQLADDISCSLRKLGGRLSGRLDPVCPQPRRRQRNPQVAEAIARAWRDVHNDALRRRRCRRDSSRIGGRIDQRDLPRLRVEPPAWLSVPESDPGYPYARTPEPHVGDPGPDIILVAAEPFRVGDLAALQLDGNAGTARQNDLN